MDKKIENEMEATVSRAISGLYSSFPVSLNSIDPRGTSTSCCWLLVGAC